MEKKQRSDHQIYEVVKQKDKKERSGHLETKIMEAAQAIRYPPEAEKRSKRFNDVQVQI